MCLGQEEGQIVTEENSRDTYENAKFWKLRRPAGKTRKHKNIRHISSFRNAAGRDGSASKMWRYF